MSGLDLKKEYELYSKAKSDISAFDAIYKYFLNDVYRFSYSLVWDQHDAEDLTSNTFIEFYRKFSQYEWKNRSMKSWLFMTARNLAMNKFRIKTAESIEDENILVDDTEISFVDEIIHKDLLERIKVEIRNLSPIERSLVNLRIWEEMSFKEIGEINGITEEAARKRFHRAIEKLKVILEEKGKKPVSLPVICTGLLSLGERNIYGALPESLINISTQKISMETNMAVSNGLLTSKAAVAVISVLVTSIIFTAGIIIYSNNNKSKDKDKTVEVTPTPTSTVTSTPSITSTQSPALTSTQTPTQKPTATPTALKTYTDKDVKLEFTYPADYMVTASKFTPYSITNGTEASKTIEVSKAGGPKLTLEFSTAITGCYVPVNVTVDKVFQNINTKEYLSREKNSYSNTIVYGTYSSSVNGQGQPCAMIMLTTTKYKEFRETSGYFTVTVNTATLTEEQYKVFDNIVASMKRLPA